MFRIKTTLLMFLLILLASCSSPTQQPTPQQKPGTGLIPTDEQTLASLPFDDNFPGATRLPDAVDLSDKFPTPGDQGNQGSCVGWATAYLKTYQEVVETGTDPNDLFFSPAFIYNQIKSPGSCQMGSRIDAALNLLSKQGDVNNTDFAYEESECSKLPSDELKLKAEPFRIASWRRANTQDPTEIKRHLANGSPIIIGFQADDALFELKREVYKDPPSQNAQGHAMVVVGYDDDKNAFKLINSWGTDWGDGGFGWIDYDTFVEKTDYGFVAQDLKSNPDTGAPVISSLTASPTVVDEGESSTLHWTVAGEKPLRLTLSSTKGLNEEVTDITEFMLEDIQEDVTLTLEAENNQGTTSQSITVTVGSPFKLIDIQTEPDGTSPIPFSTDEDENRVVVTLDYQAVVPSRYAGLRIWAIPYSENDVTPSSFYEPSDIVTQQSGKALRFFGVKDTGAFSQSVDAILVWVEAVVKDGNEGTSQEKRERFYAELVDVDYIFKNP
jgi:hypothetical protein